MEILKINASGGLGNILPRSQSGIAFKPAGIADADALLARGARDSDWRECFKMTGGGLGPALRFSVAASALAVAAHYGGEIIALFGVGNAYPTPTGKAEQSSSPGIVWLVAANEAARPELAAPLARASRRFVDCWLRHFSCLHNVTDPDNAVSLRWLEWLGFAVDRANPARGPMGHALYRFWKKRAGAKNDHPGGGPSTALQF